MLKVENLQKSFDGFMAVSDANLEVNKGEVVAVIGPNGAGKTTLFHLITGQVSPDNGRILFKGQDIAGLAPYLICRKGICRSYQVVNIFNRMTVFENVQVALMSFWKMTFNLLAPARKLLIKETLDILESVGLAEKADQVSGSLSHGDQKVLEIAIALGNRPELLILDEPTAGMSPEETAMTLCVMNRLSGELGLTILFCEHDMELVFSIARRIMVMQQGKTLIQAVPDQVKSSRQVQEAYLGSAE
ncbi:MAG: ABC transporter ATP-binding protein [Deltaproteobacteria bacterium]|nr:ABC transporter ATP-binding protein [Deltaproteobacteria bacterium]